MVVRVAAGCCKALYGSGWVMNTARFVTFYVWVCWPPEQSMGVGGLSQGVVIIAAHMCRSAGASESVWIMAQRKALIVGTGL
jgi:hypothetical protein